ncbi:uncharacterized protein LOC144860421 [Branchiostoma floridae x Branchiostoma japonicum]
MGNVLGTLQLLGWNNQMLKPNREEDFVEKNIGFPCRVVTGNKAVQSVFDIDLFKKEEFCFGIGEVRKDFTEGVCPCIQSNGKVHEKNKGFLMEVIAKAGENIPSSIALSVLSNVSKWCSTPMSDFESKLADVAADAVLPNIFGESTSFPGEEIRLYRSGAIAVRSSVIKAFTGMNLDEERRAMTSILEKIKTSERYQQLLDLGKSHGLGEKEATAQLLFPVFINGAYGLAAHLVGTFACLDTVSAEDREELRQEALAALKKHGGLTHESLEEMPKIESFVLEVLRVCGNPVFWSTIATRPTNVEYTTDSGEHTLKIEEGERVYASSYWALRDPAVFDKPEDFLWRRFLGPEGEGLRKHHVTFHGRLTDTPAVNNHMCPGKDVSLSALKGSIAIFNTFFGWELQEPPFWTGKKLSRGSLPDNEVKIKSFWVQHPEDLKEVFPSHFQDIIAEVDDVGDIDVLVKTKTGKYSGSGTNSNVYIRLFDDKGHQSRELQLDVWWKNDFEKGQEGQYKLKDVKVAAPIEKIELFRDGCHPDDDWYCESVSVQLNPDNKGPTYDFHVNRWIRQNDHVWLSPGGSEPTKDDVKPKDG